MPRNRVPQPAGGIRKPGITYRVDDPRMADVEALRLLPENGGLGRIYMEALRIGAAAILARSPVDRLDALAPLPEVKTAGEPRPLTAPDLPVQSIELGAVLPSASAPSPAYAPVQSIELAAPVESSAGLADTPAAVEADVRPALPAYVAPALRSGTRVDVAMDAKQSAAALAQLARFGAD